MNSSRHLEKLEHFRAYNPAIAELREAQKHEVEEADMFTRRQKIVLWLCSLVAAGIMIETLLYKFTGAPESVYIFRKMGTEPWMRWTQGIWELLASIGLLIPRIRWAGGILTTGAMAAAILSHMTWLGYSIQSDHGLLFGMALLTFTCGFRLCGSIGITFQVTSRRRCIDPKTETGFQMLNALKKHWPEYLMEAAGLGIFMVSASVFAILLYHPASPALEALPAEFPRRVLMGLAMGLTAIGIIYSPWGKQSGAHLNPAVTLTFFRLGKVAPWDALFYAVAQFAGAVAGVALVAAAVGKLLAHPSVNYVATLPGSRGTGAAFLGEVVITFILMSVVLVVSNAQKLARFTGLFAGACVAAFITFEAPISGMSMNPARTFGSAVLAQLWDSLWIYFLAPPLGMLAAAAIYLRLNHAVGCAKLHHQNKLRCIFCEYQARREKEIQLHKPAEMSLPLA